MIAPVLALIGMREIVVIGVLVLLAVIVLPNIVRALERRHDR